MQDPKRESYKKRADLGERKKKRIRGARTVVAQRFVTDIIRARRPKWAGGPRASSPSTWAAHNTSQHGCLRNEVVSEGSPRGPYIAIIAPLGWYTRGASLSLSPSLPCNWGVLVVFSARSPQPPREPIPSICFPYNPRLGPRAPL